MNSFVKEVQKLYDELPNKEKYEIKITKFNPSGFKVARIGNVDEMLANSRVRVELNGEEKAKSYKNPKAFEDANPDLRIRDHEVLKGDDVVGYAKYP